MPDTCKGLKAFDPEVILGIEEEEKFSNNLLPWVKNFERDHFNAKRAGSSKDF